MLERLKMRIADTLVARFCLFVVPVTLRRFLFSFFVGELLHTALIGINWGNRRMIYHAAHWIAKVEMTCLQFLFQLIVGTFQLNVSRVVLRGKLHDGKRLGKIVCIKTPSVMKDL
jgi:hypothetical protein